MPSLKKVTTITTSSNEGHSDDKVVSAVIEILEKSPNSRNMAAFDTYDSKTCNIVLPISRTPKSTSKAKKKDIAPNQKTLGSFFSKMKPLEKNRSECRSPLQADTKGQITDSDSPSEDKIAVKITAFEQDIESKASVTPSTSVKKGKCGDSKLNFSDDIMAIVLGSHGATSNVSSNITSVTKPRSKFGAVSVNSMLPPLVAQGLQTEIRDGSERALSKRVQSSSVLQNLGTSEVQKSSESSQPRHSDDVNLLQPRSKKDTKKRKPDQTNTDFASEKIMNANIDLSIPIKTTSTCENSGAQLEGDLSDVANANVIAGRKTQKTNKSARCKQRSIIPSDSDVTTKNIQTTNKTKNESDLSSDRSTLSIDSDQKESIEECRTVPAENPVDEKYIEEGTPINISPKEKSLLSKYESMKTRYLSRARELVDRARDIFDEEPFQKDAREGMIMSPVETDTTSLPANADFCNDWLNALSILVQGSPLPIDDLARLAASKINSGLANNENRVSSDTVSSKIKLIATRTQYLASIPTNTKTSTKVDIFADTTPELMWRWELSSLDYIPSECHSDVKKARSARRKLKNHQKAIVRLINAIFDAIECIISAKNDSTKQKAFANVSEEEEKVLKYEREEEKSRLIDEAKKKKHEEKLKVVEEKQKIAEQKRKDKDEQEEAKRRERELRLEENERKKKEAAEEKMRKKIEAETIIQEKVLKQKSMMMSFFKTSPSRRSSTNASDAMSSTTRPSFLKLANVNSEEFWSKLDKGNTSRKPFLTFTKRARHSRRRRVSNAQVRVFVSSISDNPFEPQVYDEERIMTIRNKYKFLSFREDYRPAYHGTWSKTSTYVSGRAPFGKDPFLDYDVDSEAEWEEGDDDEGEDCSETGNDDEDVDDEEGDIENYNFQDGWLAEDDDLDMEDDDDETKELRKKKSIERVDFPCKNVAPSYVIAPMIRCLPQHIVDDCPSLVPEQIEGIGIDAAMKVMDSLQNEILVSSKINLDAFPPLIQETSKKTESAVASACVPKEMSRDELITFAKFVHNSTLKSKEMLIEELRNVHKDITSSRKQAARKLDSIASKRFVGNGGGVIWEVKKEFLESLGLHHLIKSEVIPATSGPAQNSITAKPSESIPKSKDPSEAQKNTQRKKKRVELIPIPLATPDAGAFVERVKQNDSLLKGSEAPFSGTITSSQKTDASENDVDKCQKLMDISSASTPPKGDDRPSLVSPSDACLKNNSNSPSLKRKAPSAPVSKASANLLAAFLKKKKTV